MISVKKLVFVTTIMTLLFPLNAFSSRRKIKDPEELNEIRERAQAEIAARKAAAAQEDYEYSENDDSEIQTDTDTQTPVQSEDAEVNTETEEELKRLEEEKKEAERLEAQRLEAERLEKEKSLKLAEEQKKEQEKLQQQLELELEKQKAASTKPRKEYLSDYMVYDLETIDDNTAEEEAYYRIANPDERDAAGRTLLMRAARNGNEWEVKQLLDSGAKVNLTDSDGWTALMYAVRYSEGLECVESLLSAGADVAIKNKYSSTALALAACYNGNPQILTKLLDQYKSSDKEVLRALVFLLSEQNMSERQQLTKLQLFMDKAIPLNVLYEGKTPLMYAAQYCNSTKVIKILLDNQATVTLRSSEGKTAYDYALTNKNLTHDETFWALNKR